MSNLSKLKADAEAAFSEAEQQLHEAIDHNDAKGRENYNRAIIAATIAQIAMQAAEKEAEAQAEKYPASEGWRDWNGNVQPVGDYTTVDVINALGKRFIGGAMRLYWGGDDVPERIVRWREVGKASALSDDPAPIADDGWIKWEGGECPVSPETNVCLKWRDGGETRLPDRARYYRWTHGDSCSDIIAYRIIQTAADRVSES